MSKCWHLEIAGTCDACLNAISSDTRIPTYAKAYLACCVREVAEGIALRAPDLEPMTYGIRVRVQWFMNAHLTSDVRPIRVT